MTDERLELGVRELFDIKCTRADKAGGDNPHEEAPRDGVGGVG